jgi:hypothetical protein
VSLWKRVESGKIIYDPSRDVFIEAPSNTKGMTKDEAATLVKMSRKTLDDYAMNLRFGLKYGFNFVEHKNSMMGALRKFVQQKKGNEPKLGKRRLSSITDNFDENYDFASLFALLTKELGMS